MILLSSADDDVKFSCGAEGPFGDMLLISRQI
jgi:hypothetical protein